MRFGLVRVGLWGGILGGILGGIARAGFSHRESALLQAKFPSGDLGFSASLSPLLLLGVWLDPES